MTYDRRPTTLEVCMRALILTAAAFTIAGAGYAGGAYVHPHSSRSAGPDSAHVAQLLTGLGSSDAMVCEMAVDMLGNHWSWGGRRWSVGVLHDRVASEAAKDTLSNAVTDARALPILAARLSETNPCVRRAAAEMLAESPRPEALQSLRTGFKSGDSRIREAAAFGLGLNQDTTSRAELERALKDSDPVVARMAAWALGGIENHASLPALLAAADA